jgi:hypothetical protein
MMAKFVDHIGVNDVCLVGCVGFRFDIYNFNYSNFLFVGYIIYSKSTYFSHFKANSNDCNQFLILLLLFL